MAESIQSLSLSDWMIASIEGVKEQQSESTYWDGKLLGVVVEKMLEITKTLQGIGK